jgi:hypothetical protein
LPRYQRDYSGQGYPQQLQQQSIRSNKYRYTPRDSNAQQIWQKRDRPEQPRDGQQGRGATVIGEMVRTQIAATTEATIAANDRNNDPRDP